VDANCARFGQRASISLASIRLAVLFFAPMRKDKLSSEPVKNAAPANAPRESPLSLSRLRDAFASMLGTPKEAKPKVDANGARGGGIGTGSFGETALRRCEINARTVVEAMLFVGRPDNGPLSPRELAAAMRGVSPSEIEAAVGELNSTYDADGAPYYIERNNGGYRLVLRDEFQRMRDKFYGRVKEARLSPAVLEVLSVLAYNQPATAEHLSELRGAPSSAALSTLVRRQLVKLERASDGGKSPQYSTTDRFLKLFRLDSLDALPRAEELEKA
jgi:segregation and condensation protein B